VQLKKARAARVAAQRAKQEEEVKELEATARMVSQCWRPLQFRMRLSAL